MFMIAPVLQKVFLAPLLLLHRVADLFFFFLELAVDLGELLFRARVLLPRGGIVLLHSAQCDGLIPLIGVYVKIRTVQLHH